MDAVRYTLEEAEEAIDRCIADRVDLARRLREDPNREARWAEWREQNAEAIAASNAWYEKNGHPLADYMIKPGDLLSR